MDDDDDVAELLQRPQASSFGMTGWTHERELLTSVVDAINSMHCTLVATNSEGGDAPKAPTLPRPRTAMDRIEDRSAKERHDDLVAMVLPDGPQPVPDQ